MVEVGRVEIELGWHLILAGVMANLVFKAAAAVALGDRRLRTWVVAIFGITLLLAALLPWVWPELTSGS